MLEISGKTNLLEQNAYKYSLQDVAEPNLHRDIYTQGMVPKVPFNHRRVRGGLDHGHVPARRAAVRGAVHGRPDRQYL